MNVRSHQFDQQAPRVLQRSIEGRKLGGVAAGFAKYLNLDVTLVRVLFVGLSFFSGVGVAIYLAAWALMSEVGSDTTIAGDVLIRSWCR
jgi:phage shock protein C